jgi:hypothetical protein
MITTTISSSISVKPLRFILSIPQYGTNYGPTRTTGSIRLHQIATQVRCPGVQA